MKYLIKVPVVITIVILAPFWVFTMQAFAAGPNNFKPDTIMVLGAGVINGEPSKILQLRLDKTIEVYKLQDIKKVLVSGDNRDIFYNEPGIMKDYLVKGGIPEAIILEDTLGIRTFDSCKRASEKFGLTSFYIISQSYHLARASVLCSSFGLKTIPVSAEDSCSPIICSQLIREIAASWLAVLNITDFY